MNADAGPLETRVGLFAQILLGVIIAAGLSWPVAAGPAIGPAAPRTDQSGAATIAVTWLRGQSARVTSETGSAAPLRFRVVMRSRAVDLDTYDLRVLADLRNSRGVVVRPRTWQAAPGRRALEGTLTFPDRDGQDRAVLDGRAGTLTLTIRNVAGAARRTFQWPVVAVPFAGSGTAASPRGSGPTGAGVLPGGFTGGIGAAGDMGQIMSLMAQARGPAFDRAFLSTMVSHHEAAVAMAKAVVVKTRDADVKAWAEEIVRSHQDELQRMIELLRPMGGLQSDVRQMTAAQMANRVRAVESAADFDRAFITQMVGHHAEAMMMASMALQRADSVDVMTLTRELVLEQVDEIYQFRLWLARRR